MQNNFTSASAAARACARKDTMTPEKEPTTLVSFEGDEAGSAVALEGDEAGHTLKISETEADPDGQ